MPEKIAGQAKRTHGLFTALREREEGQALVEYALILLLIAVVCIATLGTLGEKLQGFYQVLADAL